MTGFGLAGHLHEMLEASGCAAVIDFARVPMFAGTWEAAKAYCRPARAFDIMDEAEAYVSQTLVSGERLADEEYDNRLAVLCDPQTSGGILAAIPPDRVQDFERSFEEHAGHRAWRIGEIAKGAAGTISFVR